MKGRRAWDSRTFHEGRSRVVIWPSPMKPLRRVDSDPDPGSDENRDANVSPYEISPAMMTTTSTGPAGIAQWAGVYYPDASCHYCEVSR